MCVNIPRYSISFLSSICGIAYALSQLYFEIYEIAILKQLSEVHRISKNYQYNFFHIPLPTVHISYVLFTQPEEVLSMLPPFSMIFLFFFLQKKPIEAIGNPSHQSTNHNLLATDRKLISSTRARLYSVQKDLRFSSC